MTVVTSTGASNQNILSVFSGTFTISAFSDTGFTASAFGITATVSGTGLTYVSQQQGNIQAVAITGGTITGVSQNNGAIQQTWTGFSVSGAAASDALANHDYTTFNNLFFGGADTFNYTTVSGTSVFLNGYGGDDVFNVSGGVSVPSNTGPFTLVGGTGNDTLNLSGGVAGTITGAQQSANFDVTGVETINLAAGADYTLIVTNGFGVGGLTLNASALGVSNHLILNSNVLGGGTYVGNVTIIGGAGNDIFQAGSGSNVFNGGGGSDTVILSTGNGVTANLSISGPQSIGSGTATFISIENLEGSGGDDTLTGDASNNILMGDGGNDVLDGGAGFDTAVFHGTRASYTIRHVGLATMVSGPDGTDTLHNMESLDFTDQTVAVTLGPQQNDFGGDGMSDVLWQKSDGTIVMWQMNAAGGVASSANLGVLDPVTWSLIGTGDYNGDSKTDILLRNNTDGSVADWLMNGAAIAGSNSSLGVMDNTWSLRGSGDFDGDGISDLVWHKTDGTVQIWRMNVSGGVTSTPIVTNLDPSISSIVSIGDYNADGRSDLLVRNTSGVVTAYLMNGSSITSTVGLGKINSGWSLKGTGDFNGDGRSDILWQRGDGSVIMWLMNANGGIGTTANLGIVDPAVWSLSVNGDYNGDGKTDVLLRNANGAVYNWLMNGAAIIGSSNLGTMGNTWATIPPVPPTPLLHAANDFDGGGRADILWQKADGSVVIWQMNAGANPPTITTLNVTDPAVSLLSGVGDYNGDGKADVLLRNSDDTVTEWLMNGAAIASTTANLGTMDSSWSLKGSGDFNGDGIADILWQKSDGTVLIWQMNASGAIATTHNLLGTNLLVSGIGDFNGDGQSDILLRSTQGAVSEWLMNNGTVSGTQSLGSLSNFWSIKGTGDFNGDGIDDILWQAFDGSVAIWQMGTLTSTILGTVDPAAWSISVGGDYNGDGNTDILLRNANGSVYDWLMNGAAIIGSSNLGTMSSTARLVPPLLPGRPSYAPNDFDGGGKGDVLWHKADGTVVLWQMNAGGAPPTATTVTTGVDPAVSTLAATGDFNGDGKADLLLYNADGTVTEWLMNGATIASTNSLTAIGTGWSVRGTGDLDGNAISDIVWQKPDGSTTLWLMNSSGGIFSSLTLSGVPMIAGVGDYNGDGTADFLTRDASTGAVQAVLFNNGSSNGIKNLSAMDSSWSVKGSGDFNGDGISDILWQKSDGTVVIWQMNASGVIASSANLGVLNPAVWSLSGVADYNGDGKADILLRNANGTVYDWLMNGTTIAGSNNLGAMTSSALAVPPVIVMPTPIIHVTNDFDGGGKADVLWQKADGTVVMWQMNGSGSAVTPAIVTTGIDPAVSTLAAVGDFNGDGKADVLLYNADGTVTEWLMNGGAIASTNSLTPIGTGWSVRGAADLNGDGITDILWQKLDGSVTQWTMNSNGAIASTTAGSNNTQYISVGDYDGDGKADILARNSSGVVTLLLNTIHSPPITLATVDFNWQVKGSGDFDGDGKSDILWQKSDGTVVIWLMNGSGGIASGANLGVLNPAVWSISAIADYNGDGKADVLLRNVNGSVYDWLMNGTTIAGSNSLGSMTSSALAVPPPVIQAPPIVSIANDFDGGGRADQLWQQADGTVVLWQMMAGAPTVTTVTTGVDPAVSAIVGVGDYNDDGKADVILQNANGTVTEWQMNGATIANTVNLGPQASGFTLRGSGDFDGDHFADLFWQKADGSVAIWYMNGGGTSTTNINAQIVSIGDYNGDGMADLLARNAANGAVTEWQWNGHIFTTSNNLGVMDTNWQVFGSGDFDGDGKADILWQKSDGTVVIWLMNASGAIASSANLGVLPPSVWSLSGVADYNGDGKADILLRNANGAVYDWLMNGAAIGGSSSLGSMASSALAVPPSIVLSPPPIAVSNDFGLDGRADQLWQKTDGTVVLWQMNAGAALPTVSTVTTGVDPAVSAIVGIGDFNGDGKADALLRNADGTVTLWLMNGASIASTVSLGVRSNAWAYKGSGDFDGDGVMDILWQKSDGTVGINRLNGAGQNIGTSTFTSFSNGVSVTGSLLNAGDYNGDGKVDILTRDANGVVSDWLTSWGTNGYSRASINTLGTMDSSWRVVGSGDFDGDKKADILWQKSDGTIVIWLMNASGTVASSTSLGALPPATWSLSGVADYNGDGKADILLRNANGTVYDWLMNGAGIVDSNSLGTMTSSAIAVPTTQPDGIRPAASDFDSNGRSDILWEKSDGTVAVWRMDSAGAFSSTTSLTSVNPAQTSFAGLGDINGDGFTDILLHNSDTSVTQWLMTTGAAIGSTPNFSSSIGNTFSIVGTADFNSDEKADILWDDPNSANATLWLQVLPGLVSPMNIAKSGASILGVGDFDGDSRPEILVRNPDNSISSWTMSLNNIIRTNSMGAVMDSHWSVKGLGDFGGDGKTDVLWQKDDGTVVIWQMNAGGTIGSNTNLGVLSPATWSLLGAGDYNGDGKADVLLRNNSTGAVYDWLMNGAAIAGSNSLGTMNNSWTAITR